ncbi:MAG: MotA/TolQ/ExbB proton channel family protein [Pirellula sp.]|jgi:biopolymer transport protein ExbB|nr:MotA/TolQ/ExbB proton channel family protein [Pirellula sp.]
MSGTQSLKPAQAIRRVGRCAMIGIAAFGFGAVMCSAAMAQYLPNGPGGYQSIPNNSPQPTQNNRVFNSNAAVQNTGMNNSYPGQPDLRVAANPNAAPASNPSSSAETTSEEGKIPVRNLLQIFHDGGIMMYPIAICSFVLTVFSFERLINLRTGRVIPRPFVKRLIEQLQQQQIDREEALELCERNPSAIASILAAALKRYGRPAVEVEQAVLDAGERETNHLRRHMRLLNAISNVAPLLGLLGTVMGMIQSFNDISGSQAMGRPEMLAGGISEALLTTAAGLLVAIPAYLMYMYFLGHTDRLVMEMDRHAQQLVDTICAEGLSENETTRSRSRSRKAA